MTRAHIVYFMNDDYVLVSPQYLHDGYPLGLGMSIKKSMIGKKGKKAALETLRIPIDDRPGSEEEMKLFNADMFNDFLRRTDSDFVYMYNEENENWFVFVLEHHFDPGKQSLYNEVRLLAGSLDEAINSDKTIVEADDDAAAKCVLPKCVTKEMIKAKVKSCTFTKLPSAKSVICELVMKNGFSIAGRSACVSLEEFDWEEGKRIAYEDAINKIWPMEAYLLQQQRYEAGLQ